LADQGEEPNLLQFRREVEPVDLDTVEQFGTVQTRDVVQLGDGTSRSTKSTIVLAILKQIKGWCIRISTSSAAGIVLYSSAEENMDGDFARRNRERGLTPWEGEVRIRDWATSEVSHWSVVPCYFDPRWDSSSEQRD
jgi:hypothetical protein